jgi:hypothetical protein
VNRLTKARKWLEKHLPDNPWIRIPIGVLLVIFGILGFLPILGFWMVPVGLAILAIDFPPARKLARWLTVKIGRKFKKKHA